MKKVEAHKHWWWGENKQWFPEEETLIHMNFPRCFIRYVVGDAYFIDYEEFVGNIAEIQWFDGTIPSKAEQERVLTDAWNFLAIEERLLEQDLEDLENELDEYDL